MTNKNVKEFRAKLEEKISKEEAKKSIQTILKYIVEKPDLEGLIETPKRVIKAFDEYFSGYADDPQSYLEKTFGDVEGYDDMVIQKNISIQSHCEHHMAPIIGIAHVAYIPSEKVVGLSKLARVVEAYSRRLQTQERLTMQIANAINKGLKAHGTAVCIDAIHQCMTTRGVMKENATTVTNYFTGSFRDSQTLQQRFLAYINQKN
jgi:GTP cyclohydrolase I